MGRAMHWVFIGEGILQGCARGLELIAVTVFCQPSVSIPNLRGSGMAVGFPCFFLSRGCPQRNTQLLHSQIDLPIYSFVIRGGVFAKRGVRFSLQSFQSSV